MTTSDLLFKMKADLHNSVVEAISELYDKITDKLLDLCNLYFDEYADKGICERVGTWIMYNNGETGEWGIFTCITKKGDKIWLTAEGTDTERYGDAYDFYAEELIYLYDELEKIYESLA